LNENDIARVIRRAEQKAALALPLRPNWSHELRRAAAARIRLASCWAWREYAEILDPYRAVDLDESQCWVGRYWSVCDPDEQVPVVDYELREQHPELTDSEWTAMMTAAARRRLSAVRAEHPDLFDSDLGEG
jgi:hypothetical protein